MYNMEIRMPQTWDEKKINEFNGSKPFDLFFKLFQNHCGVVKTTNKTMFLMQLI